MRSSLPSPQFLVIDPDINSTRAQNWNVTVERQIGHGLAGVGELSRQLPRSPLGRRPSEPRRLPRTGSLHAERRELRHLHHGPRISTSGGCCTREPGAGQGLAYVNRISMSATQSYRALRLSFRRRCRQRPEPQRELHAVALHGGHRSQRQRGCSSRRVPESRGSLVRSRQLRQQPDAHRQRVGRCPDAELYEPALRIAGVGLARVGHLRRPIGQLAHRDHRPRHRSHRHRRPAAQPGQRRGRTATSH